MNLSDLQDIKAPVSQSSFSCGMKCERCYLYRYRWGLRPKVAQYTPSADLGTIYHWLKKEGADGVEVVRKRVRSIQEKLMERIDAGEDLTGDLARSAGEITNLFNKALVMAQIFWEKYPPNPNLITLCREEAIECEITGLPAKGRLDHIQMNGNTGVVWIRDEKSSSLSFAELCTGYEFSIQCRWYRLLAEAWLKRKKEKIKKDATDIGIGLPTARAEVSGFVLDYMMFPGIKFCDSDRDFTEEPHTFKSGKRKGETEISKKYFGEPKFENYLKRVKQWYIDNMDSDPIRSMAILFSEPTLPDEMMPQIERIRRLYTADPVPSNFPRDITRSHCVAYRRVCPYYELCSADETIWPDIIERLFTAGNYDHQGDKE